MTAGIMQPYFLPYIGYFQLIHSVDIYVNLDHVSFMKRSYMTRNLLRGKTPINLQVNSGSQNKSCNEVTVNFDNKWLDKTYKKLFFLYKKEKNFDEIMEKIISKNIRDGSISVSEFNFNMIKDICKYLEIGTLFIENSKNLTYLKKEDGLIDICKKIKCTKYINAIGGLSMYDKNYFLKNGISLQFCKMEENIDLKDPYASIIDILFVYPKHHIQEQITKYKLI